MVLPMVLMEIVLIIYLFIFQYDRCLLELDLGVLALRGATMEANGNQDRLEKLEEQAGLQNREKYITWEWENIKIKIERGKLRVEQEGRLSFPFWKGTGETGSVWTVYGVRENRVFSPVSLIRTYRSLTGGK